MADNSKKSGLVYLAECPSKGILKIGFSSNVRQRLGALRFSEKAEVIFVSAIKGFVKDEMSMHKSLRRFRCKGEWYFDCEEVRALFPSFPFSLRHDQNHHCAKYSSQKNGEPFERDYMALINKIYATLANEIGLSLKQFCVNAGINRATLSRWAAGAKPTTASLGKLAKYAKVLEAATFVQRTDK